MADVMEVDATTGDVVMRDMTAGEVAQHTKDLAKHAELAQAKSAKQVARLALLDRLGLTEQEAQLLLGS